MGDKQAAGEPGMSNQLHVQQEWEQVCPSTSLTFAALLSASHFLLIC